MGERGERRQRAGRLCYHGTDHEVRFGDEVLLRRFILPARRGVVCHIHGGMSSLPELEVAGVPLWTVRDDEGHYHHFVYEPGRGAPRSVVLVARAGEALAGPSRSVSATTPPC